MFYILFLVSCNFSLIYFVILDVYKRQGIGYRQKQNYAENYAQSGDCSEYRTDKYSDINPQDVL